MESKKRPTATGILCEFLKLKSQQKYLEAAQLPVFDTKGKYNAGIATTLDCTATLTEIRDLKSELDTQLPVFKLNCRNDLESVLSRLSSFKSTMLNPTGMHRFNTKEYREEVVAIDQAFRELSVMNVSKLTQLKKEFCAAESNLLLAGAQAELLHEGHKVRPIMAFSTMRRITASPIDKSDSEDVRQFDDFVRAHKGHTGGWIEEQHNLFVKLKSKYKENMEQIVAGMQAVISGMLNINHFQYTYIYFIYINCLE